DFNARLDHEPAEIHRLDLSEPALELHYAGITDLGGFDWFESPPSSSIHAADDLLYRLGAIDREGNVTAIGVKMLRFPLHPRQSRMMVEAELRGVVEEAAAIAALIGERDIVSSDLFKTESALTANRVGPSDLLDRFDLFEEAAAKHFSR